MRSWLARLASLKLSVGLLAALLLALAVGTIMESSSGTAGAGRTVYYALWFQVLLAALVLNVVASIVVHFPWGKWRVGFLMTHTALIVILAGALVSFVAKTEGHLPIWEGEQNAVFLETAPVGTDSLAMTRTRTGSAASRDAAAGRAMRTTAPIPIRSQRSV